MSHLHKRCSTTGRGHSKTDLVEFHIHNFSFENSSRNRDTFGYFYCEKPDPIISCSLSSTTDETLYNDQESEFKQVKI